MKVEDFVKLLKEILKRERHAFLSLNKHDDYFIYTPKGEMVGKLDMQSGTVIWFKGEE